MTDLRKGQVRLGLGTWRAIREAYLGGASAASLAQTYGCSLGTIRMRARDEGWRRCDVEGLGPAGSPAAVPAPRPREPEEPVEPEEMVTVALAAAMRALMAGKPSDAAAYLRVAEAARRLTTAGEAEASRIGEAVRAEEESEAARHARADEMRRDIERRLERIREEQRAQRGGGRPLHEKSPAG